MGMKGPWHRYEPAAENWYLYNGKELNTDLGLEWYDYGARWYDPAVGRFTGVDPLADHPNQVDKSPFAYSWNNPILYKDPDGNCPNCITGLVGGVLGGLIGGGVEMVRQLYDNGTITNWSALGGNAVQGAITGAAAGFTGGASLVVTAGTTSVANIVGGAANRSIQGQETTLGDIAVDAAIGASFGAAGSAVGSVVKGAADDLSNAAKGKLGEAVTQVRYGAKGYISKGKSRVLTGTKTASGKDAEAVYDHEMRNILTGKKVTVESKFNSSGLTRNQRAAAGNVETPGGLIIDRTTSQDLGNAAKAATAGGGAGAFGQKEKEF